MAGETIVVWGTTKTLEANGSAVGALSAPLANDASYSVVSDGGGYPDAEFMLSATWASAPSAGMAVQLFAVPLDIDGTNDAEANVSFGVGVLVGSFIVNNVTSTQYMRCAGTDLPKLANYYLYNTSGQTISAGWTLKVTPKSYSTAV